jgi:hypothetical protein
MRASVAVCLLVVLAGCFGVGSPGTPSPADRGAPLTPTAPTATVDTGAGVDCGRASVFFWGPGDADSEALDAWAPDLLRLHYTLPNGSFHLVAYENGAVVGTDHVDYPDGAVADGAPLPLDRPRRGNHTIRVVVHRGDGDATFERGEDPPCASDGRLVDAVDTFDFDRFDAG